MSDLNYGAYLAHHGIKGQKWGVRRYQNKDGTLTPKGKKRYEQEILDNKGKKKENRIDTSVPNPHRWVKEDIDSSKKVVDATNSLVKEFDKVEQNTRPAKKSRPRLDLSNMSDADLRKAIDRERLERSYNDLFSPEETPKVNKGREIAKNTLEVAGSVLGVASSALGIALAISDLKHKMGK